MPKFNPHPLFPENPLYEIHSEAEIPHSDRYELWCDGRRQTVYHTDSFDYAVVVRKNSEHFPVEIHVSTAFKDVVIRPLSVGVSFERFGLAWSQVPVGGGILALGAKLGVSDAVFVLANG